MLGSRKRWRFSKELAALIAVSLVSVLPGPLRASAQETATVYGSVLDPDGRPATGFEVVFKDATSGQEQVSPATSNGEYRLRLPAGDRYQVVAVVAPDGIRLTVLPFAPLAFRAGRTYRVDVQFQRTPAATGAAGEKPPVSASKKTPWWKSWGIVTGVVIAAGGVGAAALSGSDEKPASPAAPASASPTP